MRLNDCAIGLPSSECDNSNRHQFERLRTRQASLEDVFGQLTGRHPQET